MKWIQCNYERESGVGDDLRSEMFLKIVHDTPCSLNFTGEVLTKYAMICRCSHCRGRDQQDRRTGSRLLSCEMHIFLDSFSEGIQNKKKGRFGFGQT